MIPEIVEVKVMIETLKAFVDGHLPHFVEDHEHLNDTDLGLQHDIGLGHEKNAVEGRGQGRMSDTLGLDPEIVDEVIVQKNYQMIVVVRCGTKIDEELNHTEDHALEIGIKI